MAIREIKPGVYYVGATDWDRRLFDELIPLPDGTSYNAYIIKGRDKTALIDTVDPTKEEILIENIRELGIKKLDYIISNHAEQDHSGTIPRILTLFPEVTLVTNKKCKGFLIDFFSIPEEKFMVIEDRERLSLGNKSLEFILAPWVHWPETMLTYLVEDRILFSCDLFGSHLANSSLLAKEDAKLLSSAKRYYAEIMMPFRNSIKGHLRKLEDIDIKLIVPSHGPIYQKPQFIIDAYKDWISDNVKNEVVLPYVSMHGSTEKMVAYLIDALIKRGIDVLPFNLTKTDIGELAIGLVDTATVIIGTPTVLTGPHPAVVGATYLANALRPKMRFASIIGSYGWGGRTTNIIAEMLSNLKVEIIEPVIIKGYPKNEDFKALDNLAETVLRKHRENNIV